uniref:Uncharacterized protein n=1 Tax=Plectus sambesii TaxID=2011161 RepID=A0A914VY10_9BILA
MWRGIRRRRRGSRRRGQKETGALVREWVGWREIGQASKERTDDVARHGARKAQTIHGRSVWRELSEERVEEREGIRCLARIAMPNRRNVKDDFWTISHIRFGISVTVTSANENAPPTSH